MYKATIQPYDPYGYFPVDDWRTKGITIDAETLTGAKRIASKWAGLRSGRWKDENEDPIQCSRNAGTLGILLLQEIYW